MLLLNAVLTVRRAAAGSHAGQGWEQFTDATIRALDGLDRRVVFLLWGGYARKKAALVTQPGHVVLEAGHPSPLNPRGLSGQPPVQRGQHGAGGRGPAPDQLVARGWAWRLTR